MRALLPLALAACAVSADPPRVIPVGAFDNDTDGWSFNGGWEFKGAGGGLTRVDGGRSGGAGRLAGDFAKGGAYVAMTRGIGSRPREFRCWVKPENLDALDLRLTDGTGQTFQYTLPLQGTDWQQISLEPGTTPAKGHWGGANTGTWTGAAKDVWLMLSKNHCTAGKAASLLVDDAEVVADAWTRPRAMPADAARPPADSIFGFSSHFIHNDLFFDNMGPYWRLDYILPLVVEGGFGVMREGLYQGKFADDRKGEVDPKDADKEAARAARRPAARAAVEDYLGRYAAAGVRVVLCPMFTPADRPGFDDYFAWVGDLAKRFPLQAVEMHNEPNLKHFWNHTTAEYATACAAGAKIIKQHAPDTPVVIGSISHLWWGPGIAWLQSVLASGVLDAVDGISVHPYRQKSAPEGGAMHEPADSPVGFERELRAFWGMIQGYNPGNRPLGLYLTEYGFSTGSKGGVQAGQSEGISGEERQADYLSRSMLLFTDVRLRGLPIEGIYWYDLKCDGEDPANLEHNFGLVSYDTTVLRPGFTAYAAIAHAFGAMHDFAALDLPVRAADQPQAVKSFAWRRLSDGALILAFWRMEQLQAADADFTTSLSWPLPAGFAPGKVLLHDLHGGAVRGIAANASDGRIATELNLSARAAWLEVMPAAPAALRWTGTWSSVLPADVAAPGGARIHLDAPRRIAIGASADLTVTIDNRAGTAPFAGRLLRPDGETALAATAGATATVRIPAPAASEELPQTGSWIVVAGDTVCGRGGYTVLVSDPLHVVGRPTADADGRLHLRLANAGTSAATITEVAWSSGDAHGSIPGTTIAAGGEAELVGAGPAAAPYRMQPLSLSIRSPGRSDLPWSGEVGYAPLPRLSPAIDGDLAEWQALPAIDLASAGTVAMKGHAGAADLSGTIRLAWDDANLYLAAAITDDVLEQAQTGATIFKGDSLQLALSPLPTRGIPQWHEFGLADNPKAGPQVWRWMAPEEVATGAVPGVRLATRRDGSVTTYECAIPWSDLAGIDRTAPGILFSILVNDADGKGRRGWIEWGSGIGRDKNPSLFRYLAFTGR